LLGTRPTNSAGHIGLNPNTTRYYKVAACSANGTEGAMSNTASATTLSAGGYSLDGVWEDNGGARITVNGSSGVFSKLWDSPKPITQDAINKEYVKLGSQYWRNLTSTGNLTWSGQVLIVTYNTSNPNVATGTSWTNATFTMSNNGQTLTVAYTTGGSGAVTDTWTRKQ